jgi:polar amino acid transport system substrate-binding protein
MSLWPDLLRLSLIIGLAGLQVFSPLQLSLAQTHSLQDIQKRGYLIVGVKENLRPLGFRDPSGQLQGLEIDIARRLAKDLFDRDDAIVLKPVANRERLDQLVQGQVDLVIAGVTVTVARSRLVSFSSPYYSSGMALVTNAPSIQRLSDLSSQVIAVLKQSSAISWVKYWLPKARLMGVDSYQAGQASLNAGHAIAFAGEASVLTGWVQEFPQYRRLPVLLSTEPFAVVIPKGVKYDQLRRRVDAAIVSWKTDGWLQQRVRFWGLPH